MLVVRSKGMFLRQCLFPGKILIDAGLSQMNRCIFLDVSMIFASENNWPSGHFCCSLCVACGMLDIVHIDKNEHPGIEMQLLTVLFYHIRCS